MPLRVRWVSYVCPNMKKKTHEGVSKVVIYEYVSTGSGRRRTGRNRNSWDWPVSHIGMIQPYGDDDTAISLCKQTLTFCQDIHFIYPVAVTYIP